MVVVVIQNIECPVLLFGNLETIATAIDMIMITRVVSQPVETATCRPY